MHHGLDIFKDPLFLACPARRYPAHRNHRSSYGAGLSSVNRMHPSRFIAGDGEGTSGVVPHLHNHCFHGPNRGWESHPPKGTIDALVCWVPRPTT